MRAGSLWVLLGLMAVVGCGSSAPSARHYSPEQMTKLHDLLGHPTYVWGMSSTSEAQLDAINRESLSADLEKPDGLVATLNQMASATPDVQFILQQKADHRVMLPEVEAILGKSSGIKKERPADFEIRWHQYGWIEVGFIYGGERKGDTSQNAGFLRLSARGYKDSQESTAK